MSGGHHQWLCSMSQQASPDGQRREQGQQRSYPGQCCGVVPEPDKTIHYLSIKGVESGKDTCRSRLEWQNKVQGISAFRKANWYQSAVTGRRATGLAVQLVGRPAAAALPCYNPR